VPKDKSAAFRLDRPVGELVVAQPSIAEIVAKTDRSFYIRGKANGATNILVYDPSHNLIEVIDVRVGADSAALEADIASTLPGEAIRVTHLADGVHLSGEASTNSVAARAVQLAERYAPKGVTSAISVRESQQVILEVRIIEASRSALQDFGVDLSVIGRDFAFVTGTRGLLGPTAPSLVAGGSRMVGNANVDVTLRALEEQGLIRTLARPNLVALSGEEAEFLAGGEFPYPIPVDQNEVAIEFKPFGVALKFTPLILPSGAIRVKVAPEVSQLDVRQQIRINGIDLPSLTVRRATTTVELDEGASFAIAGLFQEDYINTVRETPGLANLPVLGALFKSQRWRRQETELLIVVTPRIADKASPPPQMAQVAPDPGGIDMLFERLAAQPVLPALEVTLDEAPGI
jgi:pilus assembly protein CpaC